MEDLKSYAVKASAVRDIHLKRAIKIEEDQLNLDLNSKKEHEKLLLKNNKAENYSYALENQVRSEDTHLKEFQRRRRKKLTMNQLDTKAKVEIISSVLIDK